MPINILPETPDPAAESRDRIHRLAEDVNQAALEIQTARDEFQRLEDAEDDLTDRYAPFAGSQGRNVGTAILAVALPLITWVVDLIFLAPLADFMLDWAQVPANQKLPLRITLAFVWTLLGYGIGAKLGVAFVSGKRSAWIEILPAAAYVLAMPVIAWFTSGAVFAGPQRLMLIPMAAVLSTIPVLSGYFVTTAFEYLAFLMRKFALRCLKTAARRRQAATGQELLTSSQRMAVATTEHQRRFGERVEPFLTPLAQRLIEEFSRGNITVVTRAPGPESPEHAQLAAAGEATRRGTESDGRRDQAGIDGRAQQSQVQNEHLVDYLRQQLAQRAQAEDSELVPPASFSQRLQ